MMNEVENDFLKRIADNIDIVDIVDILGITSEELVTTFADFIMDHRFYDFKEFMDGSSFEGDETTEET